MHVLDVAAFLLGRVGAMEAMKLQKLVYYSQAWALALLKRPLFAQEIQAWTYGPVAYELYQTHRGQYVVTRVAGDPSVVEADASARELIERVVAYYGSMSGSRLSKMTHSESPWRDARQVPDGVADQSVISLASMQAFYGGQQAPWLTSA